MFLWYPVGLPSVQWQAHLFNFSIVYLLWLVVFFSYRLFEWDTLRIGLGFIGRLIVALLICLLIAVVYFYFQPALLITPRRFLLVHMLISGVGIAVWFWLMRRAANLTPRRKVYIHNSMDKIDEVENMISNHQFLGLEFAGEANLQNALPIDSIVVIPSQAHVSVEAGQSLFSLRNQGVRFVEFYDLYESLHKAIHLDVLTDLWFIHSVDYGAHRVSDGLKRALDILFGLVGMFVFVVTYPIIGLLIKLTSKGPVFFVQSRVGQFGKPFLLYKYRTMLTQTENSTWTLPNDSRVTTLGKFLRATRLDELPQSLNIVRGDMSIVGPRPEQVNIVKEMREQIPYYDERHIVKPGLTGWAQLHVYAATVEETRRKLQYDLYYIKHRSLLFDLEIIIKTAYNIFTLKGR
jgi:lipopolysaccharide/colanic/teichoic acid biosynthesis glycosyltransferase